MIVPVRKFLGRIRRAVQPPPPALSVVIPVYNVGHYLNDCLDSVLGQKVASLEVIIVDDGSTDSTADLVRQRARNDQRVRVFSQRNQGQGRARNLGVRRARGEFLMFVDGDDIVLPEALPTMLSTLRKTGSDFVSAPVLRLRDTGKTAAPSWNSAVFDRERLGIAIDDFPTALADILACNRMFRRTFWTSRVGEFDGGAYEDHVPMLKASLRARSFDLLTDPIYHWRQRSDGSSTSQRKRELANLIDRLRVKDEAWALLQKEATPAVRDAWLGRVIDLDLPAYLPTALCADEGYQATLQAGYQRLLQLAQDTTYNYVKAASAIQAALVADGRWSVLGQFRDYRAAQGAQLPTTVREGEVYAAPTLTLPTLSKLVPDPYRLSAGETPLAACLRSIRIDGASRRFEVTGWAAIRGVDDDGQAPRLDVWVVDSTGQRTALAVTPRPDREATVWSQQRFVNNERCGFTASLDLDALMAVAAEDAPAPDTWTLGVTVEHRGVRREGPITQALAGSQAATRHRVVFPASATAAIPGPDEPADGWQVVADGGEVFGLRRVLTTAGTPTRKASATADVPVVHSVGWVGDRLVVSVDRLPGRESGPQVEPPRLQLVAPGRTVTALPVGVEAGSDGRWSGRWAVELTEGMADPGTANGNYAIIPLDSTHTARLSWAGVPATDLPRLLHVGTHRVSIETTPSGQVRVRIARPLTDDERGQWCQQRLRERCAGLTADRRQVLVTGMGQTTPRLVAALASIGPVPAAWTVAIDRTDPGLALPASVTTAESRSEPGGAPPPQVKVLVRDSEPWHRARAASRIVVTADPHGRAASPDQHCIVVIEDDATAASVLFPLTGAARLGRADTRRILYTADPGVGRSLEAAADLGNTVVVGADALSPLIHQLAKRDSR